VPWEWRRILLAVGAAAGLAVVALAVDERVSFTLSLPLRLGLSLAYPLALLALGFFPSGDLARAWARARALAPR
jgi:hypothetical protein